MFSIFKKKPMVDLATQKRVEAAIGKAEKHTSGEVRVYMEHHCPKPDAIDRAKEIFAQLGMEKTEARDAVLVYVATTDRKFALFGDTAIYEKAGGPAFWQKAADQLRGHLSKNQLGDGLCHCIEELGKALATHFPADPKNKKNELPDEIVFGK